MVGLPRKTARSLKAYGPTRVSFSHIQCCDVSPDEGVIVVLYNNGKKHKIDLDEGVDDKDEISGDYQLVLVWCITHKAWEWHNMLRPWHEL